MTEPTADITTWRTPSLVRLQAGGSAHALGAVSTPSEDPEYDLGNGTTTAS